MNKEKKTYVVLEFAAINGYYDKIREYAIIEENIVEVAAVKIEEDKILNHFHSFISIDDCDPHDIALGDVHMPAYHLQAAHLIGAPSFEKVAKMFFKYVDGATIILHPTFYTETLFSTFKEKAKKYGYIFDNATIDVKNVVTAAKQMSVANDLQIKLDNCDALAAAQLFPSSNFIWADVFREYGIIFDIDSKERKNTGRDDPLGWALAFARLVVAIITSHKETIYEDEIYNI